VRSTAAMRRRPHFEQFTAMRLRTEAAFQRINPASQADRVAPQVQHRICQLWDWMCRSSAQRCGRTAMNKRCIAVMHFQFESVAYCANA
jgi:hypothetical protein